MSESNLENLSAAADGQLSAQELRFLMRRLDHDQALRDAWDRFHLAGDGLRGQVPGQLASAGFAARVMAAIDQAPLVAVAPRRRHWLHWSAGGAIAAGVAVAALMVSQPAGHRPDTAAPLAATHVTGSAADGSVADVGSSPAAAPQWLSGNVASRLTQQAAYGSGSPMASYPQQVSQYQVQPLQPVQFNGAISANDARYMILLSPVVPTQAIPQQQRSQAR
ncbi:MAG TPA: sigma-E factor negative regulatory protein [Pinirhizobacter sp.]|uniref:sigma-E factor negative regulatory protein n=1 Tax=Pinirhizobacter sp. TaxID=2950432 RepID=UPI002C503582|nr:sigma-E factor negative regulatory protein [Pinirhizobacter sp.]HMH67597.1 sigma-E factor negative regulatory protein [Pinirhizobacter sp.]